MLFRYSNYLTDKSFLGIQIIFINQTTNFYKSNKLTSKFSYYYDFLNVTLLCLTSVRVLPIITCLSQLLNYALKLEL